MDTITHGLLGGVVARAALGKKGSRSLVLAGSVAAMFPDIDVFIRSKSDPLLFWMLHRNFTHSFLFAPVGALTVAFLFWLGLRRKTSFKFLFLAAFLGYLTHLLLDAATSFGTLLYWPFSHYRVSWDVIAVIDPVATFILLVGFIFSVGSSNRKSAILSWVFFLTYLNFGIYQHQVGKNFQYQLAQARGHTQVQGRVMPTLANLFIWRSIYTIDDTIFIDAFRLIPGQPPQNYPGGKIKRFELQKQFPHLPASSILAHDIRRFSWFAEGYVGVLQTHSSEWILGDMRYSTISQGETPIWGIGFSPLNFTEHVQVVRFPRDLETSFKKLWNMVFNGT